MTDQSVGVIGVGRLGSDVAFTLAERDLCDIVLYDKDTEKAAYLASDLRDTAFGHEYPLRVSWTADLAELNRCSVILIAAGMRMDGNTSREELFRENRLIAEEVARTFIGSSILFVVASDPVDLITAELTRLLKLPSSRVMGVGGVVDAFRVRYAIAETLSYSPDIIRSHVVGPQGRESEVLWDYTSVNGVPLKELTDGDTIEKTRELLNSESHSKTWLMAESASRYTPALACLELIRCLVQDDRRVLSVTVSCPELTGVPGVAMSVPAVVGRFGAERLLLPKLEDESNKRLKKLAESFAKTLEELG